jgi:hypothetical protein
MANQCPGFQLLLQLLRMPLQALSQQGSVE